MRTHFPIGRSDLKELNQITIQNYEKPLKTIGFTGIFS